MNILKLKIYALKLMMTVAISILALGTASAQLTWDGPPSHCDDNYKRSISVSVKNNTNKAANHTIKVYKPNSNTFIHGSHNVYIKANETKPIVLNGIPEGNFIVYVLNENAGSLGSKSFNFKPCPKESLVWDDQPSNCVNKTRSISVTVKNNNFYDSKFKLEVYNGERLVSSGGLVSINKHQTKKITLSGIPVANTNNEYKVMVKRYSQKYAERFYNFYECEEFKEETLDWISKPSNCTLLNYREIEVKVTNNSGSLQNYQLQLIGAGSSNYLTTLKSNGINIGPNQTATVKKTLVPQGKFTLKLLRGFEEIFSESIQLNACDLNVPDNTEWDSEPGGCQANQKRSIGVNVTNNGGETSKYRIEAYNYDYISNSIKGVVNSIALGDQKRLELGNIPAGNYRVVVAKKDNLTNEYNVISSENHNFMSCSNSSTLKQLKAFQPIFTKMETPASINLNDYFSSAACSNIAYTVKKLSPGTVKMDENIASSMLTITPTNSFLGKSLLEITASCGATEIVSLITVYVETPLDLFNNCNTQIVNIGVLNYNPMMDNNKLLHETYNWRDPMLLAEKYIEELTMASGKYIYFNINKWINTNDFPHISGRDKYTVDSYKTLVSAIENLKQEIKELKDQNAEQGVIEIKEAELNALVNKPERFDYPKNLKLHGMPTMVNQKLIDEVWHFGGGYFRGWESCMAGPGAYYINGTPYPSVESNRPFAIMGFSYKEYLKEMLHNNGHRTESHMKRAYNVTWNRENPETNWDRFTANEFQVDPTWLASNTNFAGVGNIHFPPNATFDYDFNNDNPVESTALDYVNYPNLTGNTTMVNQHTWGTVWQESFMKWWFNLLPKADGINNVGEHADGRMNNWWKYIYDFNSYDYNGRNYNTIYQIPVDFSTQYMAQGIGKRFILDLDDYVIDTDVAIPQFRIRSTNNIPIIQEGSKLYAYVPTDDKTVTYCYIKICDGDYSITRQFYIFFDNAKCSVDPNCRVNDNREITPANTIKVSNYPNPFNTQTTISYTLPQSSTVSIKIYNGLGEQIEVLANNAKQQAGTHRVNFDGTKYPSGIYYYGIQHNDHYDMQKMILMRDK